eukprot:UN24598
MVDEFGNDNGSHEECGVYCTHVDYCIGYSYFSGSPNRSRCALWIDDSLLNLAEFLGWERHTGYGWDFGVNKITTASGDAGWTCYKDKYVAPTDAPDDTDDTDDGTPTPATTTTAPDDDTDDTDETDAPIEDTEAPNYNFEGVGVCQDAALASPANYSQDDIYDRTVCEDHCEAEDGCIGYSHNTVIYRCALWINLSVNELPPKGGEWERHSASGHWDHDASVITRASGDVGWSCYTRINFTPYELMGIGVCQGSDDEQAANYSRDGQSYSQCRSDCLNNLVPPSAHNTETYCAGYSYFTNEFTTNLNGRCALWMDEEFSDLPNLQAFGYALNASTNGWEVGMTKISKADGSEGWICKK